MAGTTISEVQTRENGVTEGFDYLRVGLSVVILLIHSISIVSDHEMLRPLWFGPLRFVLAFSLPMFFCLSGFLVSSSLVRNDLFSFFMLRVIRIVPALAFETILCAVFLGGSFTVLSLDAYFSSRGFFAYFGNIVGLIHYTLPGVFSGKPLNVQLWTIPFELECYAALLFLAVMGIVKRRMGFLLVTLFILLALSAYYMVNPYPPDQPQGRVLVSAFLAGVAFFLLRDRVVLSWPIFLAALLASMILLDYPALNPVAMVPLTYVTVFIGLMKGPKLKFGDLSYGVYLFHYPVIRAFCEITGYALSWPVVFTACLAASLAFAALSWTLIEQPVLRKKRMIIGTCARWTGIVLPAKAPAK